MRSLLRRIIHTSPEQLGDLATGDWSPVPSSVTAVVLDVAGWLETEEVRLPPVADKGWRPAPEQFTAEELEIIADQRRAPLPAPPAVHAAPPAVHAAPPRPSWVDVLKSFGENLTDSELRIIREQLAS